jgi:hypothetical protein
LIRKLFGRNPKDMLLSKMQIYNRKRDAKNEKIILKCRHISPK